MDATTALNFYAFLIQMLNTLPNEVLVLIFEFLVRSHGKNIIHVHHDMQTATMAIAGSAIVSRQPNGVTIMIHDNFRRTQVTRYPVVPLLSVLVSLRFQALFRHSAIALGLDQMSYVTGTILSLIMSAIERTSDIRLFPMGHDLTALPTRDTFARLVSVLIIIPLNYMVFGTLQFAKDRLQWIQNNMILLLAHTPTLKQLKLHVKYKDLRLDSMNLLSGQTSIDQELIATMGSMIGFKGKQKLIGEYMLASSATMANECAELEGIVAAAGRNYIDTFVDVRRCTVEVTVEA